MPRRRHEHESPAIGILDGDATVVRPVGVLGIDSGEPCGRESIGNDLLLVRAREVEHEQVVLRRRRACTAVHVRRELEVVTAPGSPKSTPS